MLAIVGAMAEEIDLLEKEMTVSDRQTRARFDIIQGTFQGVDVVSTHCGVGKVNAAICTQMLIDHYPLRALVFCGVAGGLLPNMRIGDLVIASHLIQYDMDLTAFGRRHGELPGKDRMIEADPELVQKATKAYDSAFPESGTAPNLMLGTVVSGDRFVKDPDKLRWLQREFSALATEMEGAAVGYTCDLNTLPFVVVRGLSDTAGDAATEDYASSLSAVCQNCYRLLAQLIPEIG
jgi:adenosylhomocysteine nucleosidase